jgi:CRISPR-associated protein Cas5d
MPGNLLGIEVRGDFACFTRPELKVERMSYPVITPSAARGVFDAIYVKPPEFRWQVRRIEVLREPRFISLRRNEVKDVVNVHAVTTWMRGGSEPEPLWADGDRELLGSDEKGRTQRQTIALQDVHYRLWAEIRPWPEFEAQLVGFEEQFKRRVSRGKCFYQPYLGCREFVAYFSQPRTQPPPVDWSQDLGVMLYDVFDLSRRGGAHDAASISLFSATARNGVVDVPEYSSSEVRKLSREGSD